MRQASLGNSTEASILRRRSIECYDLAGTAEEGFVRNTLLHLSIQYREEALRAERGAKAMPSDEETAAREVA